MLAEQHPGSGQTAPVVAGLLSAHGEQLTFNYGRSYLGRWHEQGNEFCTAFNAAPIGSKFIIHSHADDAAILYKLAVIPHGNNDVTIRRFKSLIGHNVGVGIAEALWNLPTHQIIEALIGKHGHLRIQQSHINKLA